MTTNLELSLRLLVTAKRILGDAIKNLNTDTRSRSWTLPATTLADEVSHYQARHSELALPGPRPRLDNRRKLAAAEVALKIDAAAKLRDLGAAADPLIKPVLLYYSAAHVLGAYSRAFLGWDGNVEKHGIRCVRNLDLGQMSMQIEDDGFFPRLSTTLFLLTGSVTVFAELVTFSTRPTAHTAQGELLEKFCTEEVGNSIKKLTLNDLANFDFPAHLHVVRERHGFHKFKGLAGTALQIDILALFVASWLARYDIRGWKTVLDGDKVDYRVFFDEVFDRYVDFTFSATLDRLADPLLPWDQARSPREINPYSHHNLRFSGDPDST
jgi:hypothetical protein